MHSSLLNYIKIGIIIILILKKHLKQKFTTKKKKETREKIIYKFEFSIFFF